MKPRTLSSARSAAARTDIKPLNGRKFNASGDADINISVAVPEIQQQESSREEAVSGVKGEKEMEVAILRGNPESVKPETKTFVVSEIYKQLEELCGILNENNVDEVRQALLNDPFSVAAFYQVLSDLHML